VLQICNRTANALCHEYRNNDLVCPPSLKPGCFTVAAVDNVDHNLSSTTAQASFHGTAISLTQFDVRDEVDMCSSYSSTASDLASDIFLPLSYMEIKPCILPSKDVIAPPTQVELRQDCDLHVTDGEYLWLQSLAQSVLSHEEVESITWAAFHARHSEHTFLTCNLSSFTIISSKCKHSCNDAAYVDCGAKNCSRSE